MVEHSPKILASEESAITITAKAIAAPRACHWPAFHTAVGVSGSSLRQRDTLSTAPCLAEDKKKKEKKD